MGREELYSADVEQKALVLSGKDPKEPGARLEPDSGIAAAPTDPGTMQNFKLTLVSPPGRDGVIVRYEGISGNRPKCYANSVALWDNWYPDPTKDEPLNVTPVPSNRQPDSVPIDYTKFQGTDYLVTYQVGAALTSMCASLRLSPRIGEVAEPPSSVLISLKDVSRTSITLRYSTLSGYQPLKYRNWVGIWRGFPDPFRPNKPLGAAAISEDSTEGIVTICNISTDPTFNYTIVYFMGGGVTEAPETNAGATLSFTAS